MFHHHRQAPPPQLLPLSQLISADAPLLSPVQADAPALDALVPVAPALDAPVPVAPFSFAADGTFSAGASYEPFLPAYALYASSAAGSPAPPDSSALKLRGTPDASDSGESVLCMSTAQVFGDLAPEPAAGSAALAADPAALDMASPMSPPAVAPSKRSHSPGAGCTAKKPRGEASRITTKDFIPPDVSGLSKREARLVKNRAAAFLSRQRKREEFETMEIRVQELEQENARLRGQTVADAGTHMLSEIEQLRAQLAAAEQRANALAGAPAHVKMEDAHDDVPSSPAASSFGASSHGGRSRSSSVASSLPASAAQKPERSAASLGLMVLLCALPSLLSVHGQHGTGAPARFSLPLSVAPRLPLLSSLDTFLPSGASSFDLALDDPASFGGCMDVDGMDFGAPDDGFSFSLPAALPADRAAPHGRLAFDIDGADKLGLGGLDISFDTRAAEDGKIRVRIHPPASSTSSASSSAGFTPSLFESAPPMFDPASPDAHLGPFLGVGDDADDGMMGLMPGAFDVPTPHGGKRRVRIALRSLPTSGGEGGEWEIEMV